MFFRKQEMRKARLDELVKEALKPVFPVTEMKLLDEVAALAYCYVMGTSGWSDVTTQEIRNSMGRIYTKYVIEYRNMNKPVNWDVTDVLRHLCLYKQKYPELLKGIYWRGMC